MSFNFWDLFGKNTIKRENLNTQEHVFRSYINQSFFVDSTRWTVSIAKKEEGKHASLILEGQKKSDGTKEIKHVILMFDFGYEPNRGVSGSVTNSTCGQGKFKVSTRTINEFKAYVKEARGVCMQLETPDVKKLCTEISRRLKNPNHIYSSTQNSVTKAENCLTFINEVLKSAGIETKFDLELDWYRIPDPRKLLKSSLLLQYQEMFPELVPTSESQSNS